MRLRLWVPRQAPRHVSAPLRRRMWKRYAYSAYCVPSDVCAVDVVGQSKGLKAGRADCFAVLRALSTGYGVVLQVLNQNAGDLVYAGSGLIGDCLSGMNLVNMANLSGFKRFGASSIEPIP